MRGGRQTWPGRQGLRFPLPDCCCADIDADLLPLGSRLKPRRSSSTRSVFGRSHSGKVLPERYWFSSSINRATVGWYFYQSTVRQSVN
jgi:hypothetical protein